MKNLRNLRILASILAVLVLTLVVVLIVQFVQKRKLDKEVDKTHFQLCDSNEIQTMTIENNDGESVVFRFESNGVLSSVSYEGTDYQGEQIDSTEVNDIISNICSFSLGASFDADQQQLTDCGLSPEQKRVIVSKKDGSKTVLLIGNLNSSKSGVYVCREGETQVMVGEYSLYQSLSIRFENILNKHVIHYERGDVSEISFARKSTGDAWTVNPQADYDNGVFLEARYLVSYPMKRDPNDEMIRLCNSLLDLQITQFVPISEEDFDSYGLTDPEYQIKIRLHSGEEVNVSLSMEIGGYYYGYCSNNPYTFCINSYSLRGLNKSAFDMIDSSVIHGYLDDVRTVTATIRDASFTMDLMWASDYDFYSNDTTITLDQRNAKVYNSEGHCYALLLFKSIFQMKVSAVDYEAKPVLDNVEATFQVVKVSSESITLKLVPKDDQQYYCFINDIYSGFIVDRSVLYKDNGHEMSDFGVWDAYLLTSEAIENRNSNDVYDRP